MAPPQPCDTIPQSVAEWLVAATRARVQDMTLRRFDKHNSASKVSKTQYLCFRTLIIPRNPQSFKRAQWDMAEQVDDATDELDQSEDFQSIRTDIRNGHPPATGEFRTIPDMYTHVLREVDASYPGRLQRHDETAVNTSLLMLLHAITNTALAPLTEWRPTKIHFKATFMTLAGGAKREMVAATDGQLQCKTTHEVKAIVECKAHERGEENTTIAMQEAALFVAWIKDFPQSPETRFMVSQDAMQLYITVAVTPIAWRDFLIRSRTERKRSFMQLYRFGPWDLDDADHIKKVAPILLAITKL